ncbi:MAG: hypothetical protein HC906_02050 [Bacteroidales bacterium]|nr:hypothetical protein [Bacteroidales bacterium]
MMQNFENIDRLFSEKLHDFSEKPRPEVWDKISEQMGHKRKRSLMLLTFRIAAGIAILLSLSLALNLMVNNNESPNIQTLTIQNSTNQIPENNFAEKSEIIQSEKQNKNNCHQKIPVESSAEENVSAIGDKVYEIITEEENTQSSFSLLPVPDHIDSTPNYHEKTLHYLMSISSPVENSIPEDLPLDHEIRLSEEINYDALLADFSSHMEETPVRNELNKWLLGGIFGPNLPTTTFPPPTLNTLKISLHQRMKEY